MPSTHPPSCLGSRACKPLSAPIPAITPPPPRPSTVPNTRPLSQVRSRCRSSTTVPLTYSRPSATFTFKPATTRQPKPHSPPRSINSPLPPAVAASSRSLTSPRQRCARVISPTPAATPSPPPASSTPPPTRPAQSACAHSAPSQPGLLTLRPYARSTII